MIRVGQVWQVSNRATKNNGIRGIIGHVDQHEIIYLPIHTKFIIKEVENKVSIWNSEPHSMTSIVTLGGIQADLLKRHIEDYGDLIDD